MNDGNHPGDTPLRRSLQIIRSLNAQHGGRWTRHRWQVASLLLTRRGHSTSEELLEFARQEDATIPRSTVYRALMALVELGVVRRIAIDGNASRYEIAPGHHSGHHHVIIQDDGVIEDLEDTGLDADIRRILKRRGLELTDQGVEIHARRINPRKKTGHASRRTTRPRP